MSQRKRLKKSNPRTTGIQQGKRGWWVLRCIFWKVHAKHLQAAVNRNEHAICYNKRKISADSTCMWSGVWPVLPSVLFCSVAQAPRKD